MATPTADRLLLRLRAAVTAFHPDPDGDASLLERFAVGRDEAAFAELVRRHGPLVLGVCRRALGNAADADDAFQATFLVLARRAGAIRRRDSLRCWLHGVAWRVARRAKQQRERAVPPPTARPGPPDPAQEAAWRELCGLLDDELARLPERLRAPLILCFLQGRTRDEAAAELGWSLSTLKRRLGRGREVLRAGLTGRGLSLAAGLVGAGLVAPDAMAVRAATVAETARVATAFAGGAAVATNAGRLAGVVLASVSPLKYAVAAALLAAVGTGVGVGFYSPRPDAEPPQPPAPAPVVAATDRRGDPLPVGAVARLGTVRMRHVGATTVAPLPDGRTVLSFGHGSTARVWDAGAGRLLREFGPIGVSGGGAQSALSPDGRLLAVSGEDALRLWDVAAGRQVREAKHNDTLSYAVAFSPDSRLLACAVGRVVRVRDVADFRVTATFEVARWWPTALAFCGNDTLAAAGDSSGVQLWDLPSQVARWGVRLSPFAGGIGRAGLAATADGKFLASALHRDNRLRVWDIVAGPDVVVFPWAEEGEVRLAFSPDGRTLAAASDRQNVVRLWDVATQQERQLRIGREGKNEGHFAPARGLTFSADSRSLFLVDEHSVLRCLDIESGRDRYAVDDHNGAVRGVAFAADGRTVLVGCVDGRLLTYDLTGRRTADNPSGYRAWFSLDGKQAVTAWGRDVWLLETETGVERWRSRAFGRPLAVAVAPDGRTVAIHAGGPHGTTLQLVDAATGRPIREFEGAALGEVLLFAPDGRSLMLVERITSGDVRGWDGDRVHRWDVATGRTIGRWNTSKATWPSISAAVSPDGRTLALHRMVFGPERKVGEAFQPPEEFVSVLELASGRERQRLSLGQGETRFGGELRAATAYSPDGRTLAVSRQDGRIVLWDVTADRETAGLVGHGGMVNSLAFSPDGRLLASGSDDTTALVWRVPAPASLPFQALPPDAAGRSALWEDLSSPDATRANAAIRRLVADPAGAVAVLRDRLRPAVPPDADQLARLIADLDADRFDRRTKATAELERIGEPAEAALRAALAGKPSQETRVRITRLLDALRGPLSGDNLRTVRAIESLALIGTPDAWRLLESLSKGDPTARLTREANESLARLARRK